MAKFQLLNTLASDGVKYNMSVLMMVRLPTHALQRQWCE